MMLPDRTEQALASRGIVVIDPEKMLKAMRKIPGMSIPDLMKYFDCSDSQARRAKEKIKTVLKIDLFVQERGHAFHYYDPVYAEENNIPESVNAERKNSVQDKKIGKELGELAENQRLLNRCMPAPVSK